MAFEPKRNEHGFFVWTPPAGGLVSVFVESHRIAECIDYSMSAGSQQILLNPSLGFKGRDLDFLEGYSGIKGLTLLGADAWDLTGLRSLSDCLVNLKVCSGPKTLDLEEFSSLKFFDGTCSPGLVLPRATQALEGLTLDRFKPNANGLRDVARYKNLRALSLSGGTLSSLTGIESLASLRFLGLFYMRKLKSVAELSCSSPPNLKSFTMANCRSITGLEALDNLERLETLAFKKCSAIRSLRFLSRLPNLREVFLYGTEVEDGDMSPLVGLETAHFSNKAHFSHSRQEIEMLSQLGKDAERS